MLPGLYSVIWREGGRKSLCVYEKYKRWSADLKPFYYKEEGNCIGTKSERYILGVFLISECDTHRWSQSEMPCRSGDQRVRSPPFSSVTDCTHALPMTFKLFYFLKTNELKIEVHWYADVSSYLALNPT